jgi:hypothetical protein
MECGKRVMLGVSFWNFVGLLNIYDIFYDT